MNHGSKERENEALTYLLESGISHSIVGNMVAGVEVQRILFWKQLKGGT